MPPSDPSNLTLPQLMTQLREFTSPRPDAPTAEELSSLCDMLYASSLLKEEGRTIRARIIIAPPDAFPEIDGPPDGVHAIHFSTRHELSPNEIKRISPAASLYHSVIAVWPDRSRVFHIWGILNTGSRWVNLVAGGRKSIGLDLLHPMVHIRDPGWLLFYRGYHLIAEWRGREIYGPRLDVFQAPLLDDRFHDLRRLLVSEIAESGLSDSLSPESYALVAHHIALQFVKRVVNLVRASAHGGSLVILPDGERGINAASRWIDCKYGTRAEPAGLRFRHLLEGIIRRIGELCPPGCSVEEALEVFRLSTDSALDRLEEGFFELARLFSDLMQVDGTLVLDQRLRIIGFGGEILVDYNLIKVDRAHDLQGTRLSPWNVRGDGTRHRSVYRLCSVEPEVIGFVISQDSQVRMIVNRDNSVIFWTHTVV